MDLSPDMIEALADLMKMGDGIRGPGNTGLSSGTYRALERRGLVQRKQDAYQKFKLTDAGRKVLAATQ